MRKKNLHLEALQLGADRIPQLVKEGLEYSWGGGINLSSQARSLVQLEGNVKFEHECSNATVLCVYVCMHVNPAETVTKFLH